MGARGEKGRWIWIAAACVLLASVRAVPAGTDEQRQRRDLEALVGPSRTEAHRALRRLREDEDPGLLAPLLRAWPDVDPALRKHLGATLRELSRGAPASATLDAILGPPPAEQDAVVTLLADLLVEGSEDRIRALRQRLRSPDAGVLAPFVAATGRGDACDILLDAMARSSGPPRLMVIRALGGLPGFSDRVVPVLRSARRTAGEDECEAILGAAILLPGVVTRDWLVAEATGTGLPLLARVFDGSRRPDVLLALVDRLPDTRSALRTLTGRDGGPHREAWRRIVAELAEPGATRSAVGPAREMETDEPPSPDRPTFYGIPLPRTPFVLLLDSSESMRERDPHGVPRLRKVKRRARELLDRLKPEDRFNIIFYGFEATPFRPHCVGAGAEARKRAGAFVDAIRPRGHTDLGLGLARALEDAEVTDILLLSDGLPTAGRIRTAQDVVERLGEREVRIHTVATGSGRQLMEAIARRTGGHCVPLE